MEIVENNYNKLYNCTCAKCKSKFKTSISETQNADYCVTVSGYREMFYDITCPCCGHTHSYILESGLFTKQFT